ncbi:MAG: hypothetical protein IT427_02220 [Pirellulales bacterium]|nr:hypothetical protein [Pirellulales bacterium]
MPSMLCRLPSIAAIFTTAMLVAATTQAEMTVTTDDDAMSWPQPETSNIAAIDGQPKIEIVPDSVTNGLFSYFLDSVDLSGGKIASQLFAPTVNFKLGAIAMYADGVGTYDTSTEDPNDHLPLSIHLYELSPGTSGTESLPASYNLSSAGDGDSAAIDLLGGGAGLPLQFNGLPAFTYAFVEMNFSGIDQVELQANRTYAFEIWGNSLTDAFNPRRLDVGSPGGTNPYPAGDSYLAANDSLATDRTRPLDSNRDMLMAIYEAAPTSSGHPGDFDGDGDVDGADFVAWQTHFPTASGATLAGGDADGDGDVDGADFVSWQTNFPFTPTPPGHPGDFDGDGDVDGADFVAWQTHFPTASGATLAGGDADGDGDVDGADFVSWQTNFPFTSGPGMAAVPEPAAIWLAAMAAFAIASVCRRQRHLRC